MNWFHAQGGNQTGPVSEEAFVQLVQSGTLQPSTLVWREGWPEWKAFNTLSNEELPTALIGFKSSPPPPATDPHVCSHCRKPFAPGDLVQLKGHTVCAQCKPILIQSLSEGLPVPGSQCAFTDGKHLILLPDAELPHRCVRCNAPGTFRKLATFYWNPPWVYLFLFICGPLLLVIVSLLTRKKLKAGVSLCPTHAAKRTNAIVGGWLLLIVAVVLAGIGTTVPDSQAGAYFILSFVGFVLACLVAILWVPLLQPRRITHTAGRFSKVSPEFLKDLPPWTGEKL